MIHKFWVAIKKEYYQLITDKVGIILMFLLPLLLVLIITIVQDSAFKIINENKISMLIVNHDKGKEGEVLVNFIKESAMFDLKIDNSIKESDINKELLDRNIHTTLLIHKDFSSELNSNAKKISQIMMIDLGLAEDSVYNDPILESQPLKFYYDPVLQENFCYSIVNIIHSFLDALENSLMIESVYSETGIEQRPEKLKEVVMSNKTKIAQIPAANENFNAIPNSTQHNVPAWTIFAMFFMVISLGGNIIKERINGSFIRLKTLPTKFSIVLLSKMTIYLIVAMLQVVLIFSVGVFIFPYINLPQLALPSNTILFVFFVFICALAAVSYALMIGSISKTQEQANGFGAVSIIIFAALGGIWVPVFVMPDYMQFLSNFSPLQWCLKGFYILFLKGGYWHELYGIFISLIIFIIICQLVTYYKLKIDNIL